MKRPIPGAPPFHRVSDPRFSPASDFDAQPGPTRYAHHDQRERLDDP